MGIGKWMLCIVLILLLVYCIYYIRKMPDFKKGSKIVSDIDCNNNEETGRKISEMILFQSRMIAKKHIPMSRLWIICILIPAMFIFLLILHIWYRLQKPNFKRNKFEISFKNTCVFRCYLAYFFIAVLCRFCSNEKKLNAICNGFLFAFFSQINKQWT